MVWKSSWAVYLFSKDNAFLSLTGRAHRKSYLAGSTQTSSQSKVMEVALDLMLAILSSPQSTSILF